MSTPAFMIVDPDYLPVEVYWFDLFTVLQNNFQSYSELDSKRVFVPRRQFYSLEESLLQLRNYRPDLIEVLKILYDSVRDFKQDYILFFLVQ